MCHFCAEGRMTASCACFSGARWAAARSGIASRDAMLILSDHHRVVIAVSRACVYYKTMTVPAVTPSVRTSAVCAPRALPLPARPFNGSSAQHSSSEQCIIQRGTPPLRRRRCRALATAQQQPSSRSSSDSPGKRIVITGGSKGLGLAMAREFLGCYPQDTVALCGRNAEQLEAALADLRRQFGAERVHGTTCDVSSPQHVSRLGEFVGERLGGVDLW